MKGKDAFIKIINDYMEPEDIVSAINHLDATDSERRSLIKDIFEENVPTVTLRCVASLTVFFDAEIGIDEDGKFNPEDYFLDNMNANHIIPGQTNVELEFVEETLRTYE